MIGQITPLVKVASRRTWIRAVVAHTLGSTIPGTLAGLGIGIVGILVSMNSWSAIGGVVGGILVLCAVKEEHLIKIRLPSFQRPTPKWFASEFGSVWAAFAWGVDLGQGWTTRIELVGYYGIASWVLLIGGPLHGALVMGAFGLSRALPAVVAGTISDNGDAWHIYARRARVIRRINAMALSAAGGYYIASMGIFG